MSSHKEDETLFQQLYDLYFQSISWYLYYRLGRDYDKAEDAAQQVFEKAWLAFPQFRDKANKAKLKQWLFQIATRYAIDMYRRSKVIDWKPLEVLDTHPLTFGDDPQKAIGDRELVQQTLGRMEEQDRKALILYIVLGFSLKEVAEILGIKETAIKMHISRARQKFRRFYEQLERWS